MAASGYGTKQMDGAGLNQGYIHTYSVGETPLGFIYRDKSMGGFYTTIIRLDPLNNKLPKYFLRKSLIR